MTHWLLALINLREGPYKGYAVQSRFIMGTHVSFFLAAPSVSGSQKGGARRRKERKEEMTNWENYFAICRAWMCVYSRREGGIFLPAASEDRRSKLSPCWKITTLHDRSTSLSTLLFAFLPRPGSNFTFNCKLANAIYPLQPQARLGLTESSQQSAYTVRCAQYPSINTTMPCFQTVHLWRSLSQTFLLFRLKN